MSRSTASRLLAAVPAMALLFGCELTEVVVEEPVDQVVAEVFLAARPTGTVARALLHRTFVSDPESIQADVVIRRVTDGYFVELESRPLVDCVLGDAPEGTESACFVGEGIRMSRFGPGDRLEAIIEFPGSDRRITGTTTVPEGFEIRQPDVLGIFLDERSCRIDPLTNIEVLWSQGAATWAYLAETLLLGLEGVPGGGDTDALKLQGLAISAADTSIVFPKQFGLFERADLDNELAVLLQQGLPAGVVARVEVAALDRNYTNWVRQGTFNPSGLVRIPSLAGDGTGVFAAYVTDEFTAVSAGEGEVDLPECAPAYQGP
jgi:hypothetical protein